MFYKYVFLGSKHLISAHLILQLGSNVNILKAYDATSNIITMSPFTTSPNCQRKIVLAYAFGLSYCGLMPVY